MGEQKLATDVTSEQKVTSTMFLPEVINKADIWANTYYPQMWGAKDLCVGAKALELILDGKLTWDDFTQLKPSSDQLTERLTVVNKAHRGYQIDDTSLSLMDSLWGVEKWSIAKVLESVVEELSEGGLKGKDSVDRVKFIDEFLQSDKNRPELQKVLTMWQVASKTLEGKDNLDNSIKYRESLRNYAEGILKEKGRDEAEVRKYWKELSDGFKQSIEECVENIDCSVKSAFLNSISFKVVARLPNERFMDG